MDSSVLIKECNDFLDCLSNFGKKLKNFDPKKEDSVNAISETLENNLKILENFREKMELQGFDTPYIGVGRLKGGEDDDIYEIINYSSYLRRMVDEKKGALERVKYAIVSHKIAIGNIQEDMGNKKILAHLSYDGSYKELLSKIPPFFIKSYKRILSVFETEGKGILSSITLSLVILENGKRKFKRIKIEEEDYERYIKKTFGDAIITSIKKNYSKNKLLNDQYVKKILSLAYLSACSDEIIEKIDEKLKETLSDEERCIVKKYRMICSDFKSGDCESGVIDVRAMEEIKLRKMNLKNDLEDRGLYKNGKPLKKLKKSLEMEDEILENISLDIPLKILSKDLLMYYLKKSADERTRSNQFPSILVTPSPAHLNWLVVENIEPKKILDLKFLLEKELPKYEIPIKNLGGVSLYLLYDWDVVESFEFEKKEIEEILKLMAAINDVKELLTDKIDIKKFEKYSKIKKDKTKNFLNALGKL
ncbi:hypothetical protein HNP89_000817 [Methanococcus maripaludis]|uniref:Uncharacterized protein n=1 Tax=Methanococcus maripaludis TaxID=39152 RepID=A0A7J9NYW3_METMI|nr:DUF530 family protein [Methanococcus maripaludis]MBA2852880.1 hypothetical protein [Methanococcus maripaludis]